MQELADISSERCGPDRLNHSGLMTVEKMSNKIGRASRPMCFVLLLAILIVLLMEIVFRRVQILDVSWSEELAKMLTVALSCIAASTAYKEGLHVGTGYFLTKIKNPRLLYILDLIVQISILSFLVLVIFFGFSYALNVSYQNAPSVGVSMFWPYLSIPIGFLMMLVHVLYFLMKDLIMLSRDSGAEAGAQG